jgi:adenosylhomocysteine nucleosidase
LGVRLGIVCGLAREVACLHLSVASPATIQVRCFGVGSEAAEAASQALLAEGCGALLSFGLAGGLQAGLLSGAVVIATDVIEDDATRLPVDGGWRQRLSIHLSGAGLQVREGPLFGSGRPLLTVEEKRAAAVASQAVAVDMESHAVARAAQRSGVPFMAIRAVADPAERAVPAWLAEVIGSDGRPRLHKLAAGALANRLDLLQLFRLARDQRAALAALSRVALDAGPLFALG